MNRLTVIMTFALSVAFCLSFPVKSLAQAPTLTQLRQSNIALQMEGFSFASGLKRNKNGRLNGKGFQMVPSKWSGSGFIATANGTIVTNYHVASKVRRARAVFDDKSAYEINHICVYDAQEDLAILKISSNRQFPTAKLGNSDQVDPMDQVIAVGNPKGMGINITRGDVSQVVRDSYRKAQVIRHTAPIAPGSSGGALYKGLRVVGVNASIITSSGSLTQFNQAIPVNKARSLLQRYQDRTIPLAAAFPTDVKTLLREKFESISAVTRRISGSRSKDNIGKYHFTFQLRKLKDYMFFLDSPGADLAIVIKDENGKTLGFGDERVKGYDGILLSSKYNQNVSITVFNYEPQPAKFGLKVGYISW